jgi:hypothetical protein
VFVIAASIPHFLYMTGLLSVISFVSFTYTFPAMLSMGFRIINDAMLPEETFDKTMLKYTRLDDDMKRWTRGFYKRWYYNIFDILYLCASLVTVRLRTYATIEGRISSFDGTSIATNWGRTAPVQCRGNKFSIEKIEILLSLMIHYTCRSKDSSLEETQLRCCFPQR